MKKSKLRILISMSLIVNILTPMSSLAEQVEDEQTNNQLEIGSFPTSDEDEIPNGEEIEASNELDEDLLDEEYSLDENAKISEAQFEENTEILDDESELRVTDSTIVDSGQIEAGEWVFYSDGKLVMEGIVRKEDRSLWAKHSNSIKSIDFYRVDFYGSLSSFFTPYGNLESVDFRNSDLKGVTSMSSAFEGLITLEKVSFKDVWHSTSLLTNMDEMFLGCSNLSELDVSGLNTSEVTNMGAMFYNCISLTELDVSGFDTSEVTNMGAMFQGCSGLTELDVSGFDTSQVTDMGYMFYGCSGLTELCVSGFDTSPVTNMGRMFYGCRGLTELDVSEFDTSEVADMGYMFYNCSGLTELDV
ncbi:BspA family leucine-rich repeat surface protein, partial [Enterococcus hulanensis]|uniref:BspA family leucine-rich repeat surface protein n=1 Tax=Enterococcus hulanensis TaxID=2559929 RepID=UPI001A8F048F